MKPEHPVITWQLKSNLIATLKHPQNALPKQSGKTRHVVGEVLYDSGSTVTVEAVIKDKCGFAKCHIVERTHQD